MLAEGRVETFQHIADPCINDVVRLRAVLRADAVRDYADEVSEREG